jgi:outer membrane receptor protein involved in Fe transport
MRPHAIALPLVLAIVLPSTVPAADEPAATAEEQSEQPDLSEIELESSAASVTGALQGKEGLRIQTLCTHCNSANIQVGGLSAELVPIWLSGYPVLGGLATSMIFSVLPADTVADAKVAKGPGIPMAPGRAAGGLIRLTESTPRELPHVDFTAEAGSFNRKRGAVRFAGPLSAWASASIIAGRETADAVDDAVSGVNDIGNLDRDFVETRLEFEAGRNHDFDVGFSWIDEDNIDGRGAFDQFLYIPGDASSLSWTREDTLVDRREYRAGWAWKLGRGRSLAVQLLSDNRHQRVISQVTEADVGYPPFNELTTRLKIKETNDWGSIRYRHPIGLRGVIAAGIEASDQNIPVESIVLDTGEIKPTEDDVEIRSGFVDFDFKLGQRWGLRGGLRYDDAKWGGWGLNFFGDRVVEYRNRSRTSPRATVSFRPSEGWTLKLIAGSSFRVPRPIFAEVCCGQNYERNVDTDTQTGTSVGFEGVFQPSPDLRLSVYAARNEFDDYILRMVGQSMLYVQTYALANIDETRADSLEAALRWRPVPRLTLDGSIGWLSHHNRGDELVEIRLRGTIPPMTVFLPIDRVPYEPMRTASAAATVSLPGEAEVAAQASYTGTMPIQQYADSGLLTDLRETPDFWLVSLSFRVPLVEGLELLGGIDNVTDELQNDLGDQTTDYNWGPLAGRSWRLGLRYSEFGRR